MNIERDSEWNPYEKHEAEIARLTQKLAERQAALAVKDEALTTAESFINMHSEPWYKSGQRDLQQVREALAVQSSAEALNLACREYASKVLTAFVQPYSTLQSYLGFAIKSEASDRAKQLRSGEWNPGEVK